MIFQQKMVKGKRKERRKDRRKKRGRDGRGEKGRREEKPKGSVFQLLFYPHAHSQCQHEWSRKGHGLWSRTVRQKTSTFVSAVMCSSDPCSGPRHLISSCQKCQLLRPDSSHSYRNFLMKESFTQNYVPFLGQSALQLYWCNIPLLYLAFHSVSVFVSTSLSLTYANLNSLRDDTTFVLQSCENIRHQQHGFVLGK